MKYKFVSFILVVILTLTQPQAQGLALTETRGDARLWRGWSLRPQAAGEEHTSTSVFTNVDTIDEAIEVIKNQDLLDEQILLLRRKFFTNAESEQKLFSSLISNGHPPTPIYQAMPEESSRRVEETLKLIRNRLTELSIPAEPVISEIQASIELIYRSIPLHLFRRFYTDRTVVPFHAFSHALDVFVRCLDIIKEDEEISPQDIDFKVLCYATIFHDLANIIHRERHEINSVIWMKAICYRSTNLTQEEIAKIEAVSKGHLKIGEDGERPEHKQYLEARLLHDADMLVSALDLDKIYQNWAAWTQEETKAKGQFINKFFNPDIPLSTRIEVLKTGQYARADGITDLARHTWMRRSQGYYLTKGGKRIVAAAGNDLETLLKFIQTKRQHLREFYHLDDQNIDEIFQILSALYHAVRQTDQYGMSLSRMVPNPRTLLKVAVVGSRNYPNLREVEEFVNSLPDGTVVISGGARGVDQTAERAARRRGLQVEIYKPDWKKYGRGAGPIRNTEIVGAADTVVAFWDGKSAGTKDTITKARKTRKRVIINPRHPALLNPNSQEAAILSSILRPQAAGEKGKPGKPGTVLKLKPDVSPEQKLAILSSVLRPRAALNSI